MTVKELRELIRSLPEDMEVVTADFLKVQRAEVSPSGRYVVVSDVSSRGDIEYVLDMSDVLETSKE